MAKSVNTNTKNVARKESQNAGKSPKNMRRSSTQKLESSIHILRELSALDAQAEYLKSVIAIKGNEISKLKDSASAERHSSRSLSKKYADLTIARKNLSEVVGKIDIEKARFERSVRAERRRHSKESASQKREIESLKGQIESFQDQVSSIDSKLHEALAAQAYLTKQLERANHTVDEIQSSTSWQLTKPVRMIKRLISKPTEEELSQSSVTLPPFASWLWRESNRSRPTRLSRNNSHDSPFLLKAKREHIDVEDPIPIIIHAFHIDVFKEMLGRIGKVAPGAFLYVTAPQQSGDSVLGMLSGSGFNYKLYISKNVGRDIFPFLWALQELKQDGFRFFLKLHTKKSPHLANGTEWQRKLFDCLLDKSAIQRARAIFEKDRKVGILAPADHLLRLRDYVGGNSKNMEALVERYGLNQAQIDNALFSAGSMFYARVVGFDKILISPPSAEEFGTESGLVDGTLAHAIERIIGLLVEHAGFEVRSIESPQKRGVGLEKGAYRYL